MDDRSNINETAEPGQTTYPKSRIHTQIEYKPMRAILPEDCDVELSVYEIFYFDTDFIIALGKPKYTFSTKGVVHVPIYFVPSNTRESKVQIGVYEYRKDQAIEILDKDGDIDVNQLVPIFYPYAEQIVKKIPSNVQEFLSKPAQLMSHASVESKEPEIPVPDEDDNDDDDDDDDVLHLSKSKVPSVQASSKQQAKIDKMLKRGIFQINHEVIQPPTLPTEDETVSNAIKKEYAPSPSHLWIQRFMHNTHYQIHQVESNGDCLFAVVRDAYKQIGYETTVADLRAILANEVTYEIYKENRQLFLDLDASRKEYERDLLKLKSGNAALKKKFQVASPQEREHIRTELQTLTERNRELLELKKNTETMIGEVMGDLSTIDTFEKYKDYLQTPQYWADSWAISTLEKVLNMKMIIFSELQYREDALHSVLNCGEANREIEKQGRFTPNFYIMTTYSGNHYNLLSYKNKRIFTFQEIPYDVKTMIVNKCIEKSSGIYYMIEDFRNFKVRLGMQPNVGAPESDNDDEEAEEEEEAEEKEGEHRPRSGSRAELYDSSIVFRFFAKSEKAALPGKGSGETIPKDKMIEYKDLKAIPDWRRKLDDTWTDTEHPFEINGHKYASVEHYYQASKFRWPKAPQENEEFALLFSLDSNSKIAKDGALAKAAGSKSGKIKSKVAGEDAKRDLILRPKTVQMAPDFYSGRHVQARAEGIYAKFEQIPEMKKILQMTKRAKLVHYIAKQLPEVDLPLMELRKNLR